MESHIVKIRRIDPITHDVLRIVTDKPDNYIFTPGQATELAINKDNWKDKKRPFTFTSLPEQDFLEFTIKTYPAHNGVTNELLHLKPGDELILHDVWGAIAYKGEGLFIAGGAGITPFLSIFRHLASTGKPGNNKLIFANKTRKDIIHEEELKALLGDRFVNILSDEKIEGFANGFITEQFLKEQINQLDQSFYVCGPPPMMEAVQGFLKNLGVGEQAVVVEI